MARRTVRSWEEWENVHQPFELRYHAEEGIEWCSDEERFRSFWDTIFDFIDVRGRCLDVGCGPRPPFGEDSTAVDPLAEEYQRLAPDWWLRILAISSPGEKFIRRLQGRFDTVMCWNCLDHTIGWRQILQNLAAYGAPGATYGIATDFNPPSIGHPGFERDDFYEELERHFRVTKQRENFQERDVAMVLERCE